MAMRRVRQAEIVRHFAERLRGLRLSRGMTQRDLATRASVTVSYVSTLEAGNAAPGIDLLERLATALQADVTDLLPSHTAPTTLEAARQEAKRACEAVLAKAGLETLSILKSLADRLNESRAVNR